MGSVAANKMEGLSSPGPRPSGQRVREPSLRLCWEETKVECWPLEREAPGRMGALWEGGCQKVNLKRARAGGYVFIFQEVAENIGQVVRVGEFLEERLQP